jgi:hypothetical protein
VRTPTRQERLVSGEGFIDSYQDRGTLRLCEIGPLPKRQFRSSIVRDVRVDGYYLWAIRRSKAKTTMGIKASAT